MNFSRLLLLLVTFAAVGPTFAAEAETRFSKSLSVEELSAARLADLSSDQLAVLDALVRRDIAQARLVSKEPRAPQFSARLSADERRNAGIDLLDSTAVAAIDAAVARLIVPPATGSFSSGARGPYSVPSVKLRRDPTIEVHGAAMVAIGSHGYSAFGGAVELSYDDPNHDFGLAVSYSEIHSKGGLPYRYLGDDYYRRPFDPFGRRW